MKDAPTIQFLEEYAGIVLLKSLESLYACGVNEKDMYSTLTEAAPRILKWITCFTNKESKGAPIDFGDCDEPKFGCITEVLDIEEMAWAPKYGLKGMIDASVRVKLTASDGSDYERVMPLEFKTGKGTSGQSAMEHSAQVILYTLLMSERYLKGMDTGLLYYLQTDQTRGIKTKRSDLVGLIMRRNELASDILKALTSQRLPPMSQNLVLCRGCRHLNTCSVYHKAYGGNRESSGLGDDFYSLTGHLTISDIDFLKHWDKLVDLEAESSKVSKKQTFLQSNLSDGAQANNISSLVLDVTDGLTGGFLGNGKYIYHFVHEKFSRCSPRHHIEKNEDGSDLPQSFSNCNLKCGDYVILSSKSAQVAVTNGVINDISEYHIFVSCSRRLRLPWSKSSRQSDDLIQEIWQIDKDEVASSYAIMRYNLIQLFVQSSRSSQLRKMIVDLEAPRYDSGGIFSQDPAISYIRSENSLNDDQRKALHKILTAKDYALILGMPGTGKTSTMVHAVKALLLRGLSVLLTSYTNSAVDNLLLKLKDQGIDFVRIGRPEAIHSDIHGHCLSASTAHSVDEVRQRLERVRVVGVTCLGVNHPLLARRTFDICIMDEAGQITLPVSLGPLVLCSTFVLVGDHYQLPPLVQSVEARENGLDISLFCRLSEAHPQAISVLQCQYRMCADIMELSNALIYGNRLRCGSVEVAEAKLDYYGVEPQALWLKEVLDPSKSVVLVSTDLLPSLELKEQKSMSNPTEAFIVSVVTKELLSRDVRIDDIGIITPYNSQVNLIQRILGAPVEIHTIDKYQGRDKDCILLSFVRSSEGPRSCSSSLLGDWHRINVALTRSKKKLIMVGSCRALSRVPLLKLLIEKVEEQGGIVHISNSDVNNLQKLKKCPLNKCSQNGNF